MKTIKRLNKIDTQIAENNAAFKKASKSQKRIMIAQDVLKQLGSRRYKAESGVFLYYQCKPSITDSYLMGDSAQHAFAHKEITNCTVCALGGLFMSCTNLNNNTTLSDLADESDSIGNYIDEDLNFSNGLDKFFTKNQLMLIEIYFESECGHFANSAFTDERFYNSINFDHVNKFFDYRNDKLRLKMIMENIIENNGTFVPKKLKI